MCCNSSWCAHDEMQMSEMDPEIRRLCDIVRETSFEIHKYLRNGHFKKVYENALVHRLIKIGIHVEPRPQLQAFDEDGTTIGNYVADLFVERKLVVDIKAVSQISNEHIAQLLGYRRASRIEHGLLVNFGGRRLEIKKYVLSTPS